MYRCRSTSLVLAPCPTAWTVRSSTGSGRFSRIVSQWKTASLQPTLLATVLVNRTPMPIAPSHAKLGLAFVSVADWVGAAAAGAAPRGGGPAAGAGGGTGGPIQETPPP